MRYSFRRLLPFIPDPEQVIIKQSSYNNTDAVKGYIVTYPGAKIENGMIYYIHGGGFYLGLSDIFIITIITCKTMILFRFPEQGYKMLQVMGQYLGMKALAIEYHYCPEISLSQQVDECIDGYKYIINTLKVDPKKVFICGESAGGALVLLTIQKLNKLGLPQPCGGIAVSPIGDNSWKTALKTEQEDGIKDTMFEVCPNYFDICIDNKDRKEWDECKTREERDVIARQPKYSAIYGDWMNICPLYISVSQNEVLVNDSRLIIEKCKEYKVDIEYDFDPYLLHGTVLFTGFIPEARDKLIIIIQWMKRKLNQ